MVNESKFSFYNKPASNIYPKKNITIREIIELIKSDKYKNICETARKLKKEINEEPEGNKKEEKKKELLKHKANNFDYITIAGTFKERRKEDLIGLSGYYVADLDDIENVEEVRLKLIEDKYIQFLFTSPSGDLKVGIKIPTSIDDFEKYVASFYDYIDENYDIKGKESKLDRKTHETSRACFVSYDPDCFYNPNATQWNTKKEEVKQEAILEVEPQQTNYNINAPLWLDEFFLGYCCSMKLPSGHDRHALIEKNLTIWGFKRDDWKDIKEMYLNTQRGGEDTLKGWEKSCLEGKYKQPFPGEVAGFIHKSNIPYRILPNHLITYKTKEDRKDTKAIEIIDGCSLLNTDFPEEQAIIDKFLFPEGLVFIAGAPGDFKTWFVCYMSCCIASGKQLLDMYSCEKTGILYIDEENGKKRMYKRIKKVCKGLNINNEEISKLFVCSYQDIKLNFRNGRTSDFNADLVISLKKIILENNIKVVVLDSMVRLMEGEENSSADVRTAFETIKKIQVECPGTAFVVLHHTTKTNKGGMNAMRGSGDFAAMASVVLVFKAKDNCVWVKVAKHRDLDKDEYPLLNFVVSDDFDEKGKKISIKFEHMPESVAQDAADELCEAIKEYCTQKNWTKFRNKEFKKVFVEEGGYSNKTLSDALFSGINANYWSYTNGKNGRKGYSVNNEKDGNLLGNFENEEDDDK